MGKKFRVLEKRKSYTQSHKIEKDGYVFKAMIRKPL